MPAETLSDLFRFSVFFIALHICADDVSISLVGYCWADWADWTACNSFFSFVDIRLVLVASHLSRVLNFLLFKPTRAISNCQWLSLSRTPCSISILGNTRLVWGMRPTLMPSLWRLSLRRELFFGVLGDAFWVLGDALTFAFYMATGCSPCTFMHEKMLGELSLVWAIFKDFVYLWIAVHRVLVCLTDETGVSVLFFCLVFFSFLSIW